LAKQKKKKKFQKAETQGTDERHATFGLGVEGKGVTTRVKSNRGLGGKQIPKVQINDCVQGLGQNKKASGTPAAKNRFPKRRKVIRENGTSQSTEGQSASGTCGQDVKSKKIWTSWPTLT